MVYQRSDVYVLTCDHMQIESKYRYAKLCVHVYQTFTYQVFTKCQHLGVDSIKCHLADLLLRCFSYAHIM